MAATSSSLVAAPHVASGSYRLRGPLFVYLKALIKVLLIHLSSSFQIPEISSCAALLAAKPSDVAFLVPPEGRVPG